MQWFIDMIVAICNAYTDQEITGSNAYTDQAILDAKVIPSLTIILWSGLYRDIPDGWTACDGSNGTPDLRALFPRGAGSGLTPGDIGGNVSHTHDVGAGIAQGKDRTATANHLPPWHALWYIMKL